MAPSPNGGRFDERRTRYRRGRPSAIRFITSASDPFAFSDRKSFTRQRQRSHPMPGCGKDGVADCRRQWRQRRFTHARRRVVALDEVHIDLRGIGNAQHGVAIEVRFLDAAILDRQLKAHCRAQSVDDRAFALVLRAAEVDHRADVAGDHDTMHGDLLFCIDADVGDFREVTRMAEMEGEPERASLSQRLAPAGLFSGELQHARRPAGVERVRIVGRQPARLAHQLQQELQVISLCRT